MPDMNELYGKQMTWPRLVLKTGVEALLAYNFYHYSTTEKEDWDCWVGKYRQPMADEFEGAENVSAKF